MYFISVPAKGPEKEEVLKKEEVLPSQCNTAVLVYGENVLIYSNSGFGGQKKILSPAWFWTAPL